jgi:hypothetical protein
MKPAPQDPEPARRWLRFLHNHREAIAIAADRIANVKENCVGKSIKVTAESDGAFTITNTRNGVQKAYSKK